MKEGDAIMVTTLIRMKKEGYVPDRDIILALTADEEGGKSNGVDWLIKNHRDLIDAEFVLNHDGGGWRPTKANRFSWAWMQRKSFTPTYQLTVTNPGGHSSLPMPDNAIYHLADGLTRLAQYEFPVDLNSVTRAYYEQMSKAETGQRAEDMKAILKTPPDAAAAARLSKDPIDHSTMRTTCVATRLNAGHANNALPQTAHANVNCRIVPGHSSEEVRQNLMKVLNDPKITVRYVGAIGEVQDNALDKQSYPPPPLNPEVFEPLEKIAAVMWPGMPVVPDMATGASDGIYTNAAGFPPTPSAELPLIAEIFVLTAKMNAWDRVLLHRRRFLLPVPESGDRREVTGTESLGFPTQM